MDMVGGREGWRTNTPGGWLFNGPSANAILQEHRIFRTVLDGKLYLSPLDEDPERVLDLGTGTGIWATDFAQ